jgi:hypothetical protein
METRRFQSVSPHPYSRGDGVIRFCLRGEDGTSFEVELAVQAAQRLFAALQVQLPIARGDAGREARLRETNQRLNTDEAIRNRTDFDVFDP